MSHPPLFVFVFVSALVAVLTACESEPDQACNTSNDCSPAQVCVESICTSFLPYAGEFLDDGSADVQDTSAPPLDATVGDVVAGQDIGVSTKWVSVSAGPHHTCALTDSGRAACWGENNYGELEVPTDEVFTQIGVGWSGCGLRPDKTLHCWGDSTNGMSTPPEGLFSSFSLGPWTGCAVRENGELVCWGRALEGDPSPPAGVFTTVSTHEFGACALRESDNKAECWGRQLAGEVPNRPFAKLSVSRGHVCGLRQDGAILCWGSNAFGEASAPAGTYSDVSAGETFSCGIKKASKELRCWGLPPGSTPTGSNFAAVTSGDKHACALTTTGDLECWGEWSKAVAVPPLP
ncbi:MAG: hypothetical protein AUK47_17440 [Deltaproteobacteria bacterium CG2_30_63_29]|nr:MAG: hypothetical protein AUK47_17440 [Deltaproteobacteria bacterium CG2_30_63_29]PIW01861.1 MAG: hypothetical protein COW42_03545 [Deltaproteobacteria bacterium CG17_big_fil_post_rev_8_21_14_2_50_63_7]PJB35509.1 MAG: hypothetical protein CO108_25490 [Deltaproteobacteria bacterium CG_4_9_14_3_um_filter_63_12]